MLYQMGFTGFVMSAFLSGQHKAVLRSLTRPLLENWSTDLGEMPNVDSLSKAMLGSL